MANTEDKKKEFNDIPEKPVKRKKEVEVKKTKRNNLIAVQEYLEKRYEFRYNIFIARPEYTVQGENNWKYFDERRYDNMIMQVKMDAGIDIPATDFRSLIGGPMSKDYDPVMEYLTSLPKWDGKDRFPEFLQRVQLKTETERKYFVNVFTRWFVNLVGSLVSEDTYNENCLVLAGPQGAGKTRFLRALVPKHLQLLYMFIGSFDAHDKDHREMLGTKIMILNDEMATLTRTDAETFKATMSFPHITLRRAYGRENIFLFRKASFCGSINLDEFLTDMTGNRRWLPFMVDGIDNSTEYNVGLLYAQALEMYDKGFRYWFEKDEIAEIESHNEQFRRVPMEEELIQANFRKPNADDYDGNRVLFMTNSDIIHDLASREEYRKMNVNDTSQKRLGQALKKLGFEPKSKRLPGYNTPPKVYHVVKVTNIEKNNSVQSNDRELF